MLTKALALTLACAGAFTHAAAQAPARTARPGATTQKQAAPRTPAQEARDEWNRGAIAYRNGRFADAQRHFERVREIDPKFDKIRLYVARSIHQQYRPGVDEPENVARGEQAIAAYEALLADEPANDDAYTAAVNLLGAMRQSDRLRELVMRRANNDALPAAKRADALVAIAGAEHRCSAEVTEKNRTAVEQDGKVTPRYKMPADTGDFYRAQQCATNGLGYVDHALQLTPDDTRTLMQRAGLLRELSKLAEMEGSTGQKDFYDAQHAEVAERLKGLGVKLPAAPATATAPKQADGGAAQTADGAAAGVRAVNGGVLNGKAVHSPPPEYPSIARAARASGPVVVQITIDEEGAVVSASAVSGHPLLQQAAVNAVRNWRFSPTMLSGQPVKVTGTVTVNFTLE